MAGGVGKAALAKWRLAERRDCGQELPSQARRLVAAPRLSDRPIGGQRELPRFLEGDGGCVEPAGGRARESEQEDHSMLKISNRCARLGSHDFPARPTCCTKSPLHFSGISEAREKHPSGCQWLAGKEEKFHCICYANFTSEILSLKSLPCLMNRPLSNN